MYTKKKVVETLARLVNMIAISLCFLKEHWYIAIMFFIIMIVCFYGLPWLVTLIVLKRDEFEEVDGEIFLWGDNDGKIEYHLTINDPKTIPYKEFLKIRINENARDKSIK